MLMLGAAGYLQTEWIMSDFPCSSLALHKTFRK